ncbi:acyl carrier protein [bacterium]|mgnify:CR=1 FL=1|jgi:acyl carrier protein|nr:acyl carrier protein [bacterium]
MSENNERLKTLLLDIFMMPESDYKDGNGPDDIENWDSLATVSMAVGVQEEFSHHMTPEEVSEIKSIGDIKTFLVKNGISF